MSDRKLDSPMQIRVVPEEMLHDLRVQRKSVALCFEEGGASGEFTTEFSWPMIVWNDRVGSFTIEWVVLSSRLADGLVREALSWSHELGSQSKIVKIERSCAGEVMLTAEVSI